MTMPPMFPPSGLPPGGHRGRFPDEPSWRAWLDDLDLRLVARRLGGPPDLPELRIGAVALLVLLVGVGVWAGLEAALALLGALVCLNLVAVVLVVATLALLRRFLPPHPWQRRR